MSAQQGRFELDQYSAQVQQGLNQQFQYQHEYDKDDDRREIEGARGR